MELITKLGVSWQQIAAQAVNFGIVLAILTYFVYKPILKAIDDRTARIKKSMEDAKEIENQKAEMEIYRQEQLSKVDKEGGLMLEKAKQEAEKMRKEILDLAKRESEDIVARGERKLAEERARVFSEVQTTVSKIIIQLTEKILQREFSAKDQERLLQSLEKEIPHMIS